MKTRDIWVVEQGEYSGYRVVGVFSSKQNAQLVAGAINESESGYGKATVDRWALDPVVEALNAGHRQFNVLMLRDGTTERIGPNELSGSDLAGSTRIWRRTEAPAYKGKGIPDCLQATVWARDEKHAVKIVNEQRAQMIAEGKW